MREHGDATESGHTSDNEAQQFRQAAHVVAVSAFSLATISGLWLSFTPVALDIQHDMRIGTGGFGMLVSACFFLTAVFTPVIGELADRYDLRWIQVALLLVALLGTWGSAAATSFGWFAVARLVVGASAAAFVASLRQALLVVPPQRSGLVQGVIGMSFGTGVAGAALMMPTLSNAVGWRMALVVLSLAAVPLMWAQWRLPEVGRRPLRSDLRHEPSSPGTMHGVVSLLLANFTVFGGTLTVTSFLPLFFVTTLPLGTEAAGLLTAVAVGISGTGRILGGWFADVVGGVRALVACVVVVALAVGLLHSVAQIVTTVVSATLVLIAFNASGGAVFAIAANTLPAERLGRALGVVAAGGVTGGLVLATPYGFLVERTGGFFTSNATLAALALVATVIVALGVRGHRSANHPRA